MIVDIDCRTNVDSAKPLRWPSVLPDTPNVGDLIRSLSSTATVYIELEVIRRTWFYCANRKTYVLEVELHVPQHRFVCIADFDKHVERLNHS